MARRAADPCDALVDVTAGRWRSEKVGGITGYAVFGAVAECPVDNNVPGSSAVVIGRSLSEGVGGPFRWLVGDGRDLVAMPVTDLALEVYVFYEGFPRCALWGG